MLQRTQPRTRKSSPDWITGDGWVDDLAHGPTPSALNATLVRFSPGSRTVWHAHAVGQTIHVLAGHGIIGTSSETLHVTAGDTIWTPPGERHWHGATATNFLTTIELFDSPADGTAAAERDGAVTEGDYQAAQPTPQHVDPRGRRA